MPRSAQDDKHETKRDRRRLPFILHPSSFILFFLFCLFAVSLRAAEVIPAAPTRYFNDYALTVKPATADQLNAKLEQLEKDTSAQIVVAIFPKLQSDSSVDDYCTRVYRVWKVGQKGKDNGAILFAFIREHKLWIQTGRGLEGDLPDAICKDITADKIAPLFKKGDFDGGMTAGVNAMIDAVRKQGDYTGDGKTDYQKTHASNGSGGDQPFPWVTVVFFIILAYFFFRIFGRRGGGTMYTGSGPTFFGGGFGGGGGGFGGGGSSGGGGGGGGGFSGGGGDTGGGGAGSSW